MLEPELTALFQQAAGLTEYAVVFRYLDSPREPDEMEARDALATATQMYEGVAASIQSLDLR